MLAGLGVAALSGWIYIRSQRPPGIPFARVKQEPIESTITTNGKVEPIRWIAIRSETSGLIDRIPFERGQRVAKGQIVVGMEAREARTELASAEARIEQAQAEIATLESGGRPTEIAALDADIARAELDREQARRELASLERLVAKRAATQFEADQMRERIERADSQIATSKARRTALVNPADLNAARARLNDAQAAARLAREKIALFSVAAPMAGVIYELAVQPGAFVTPGTLIAKVGDVSEVRAIVYVDEPDLGRVKNGLGVAITWDALPGREWKGVVDRTPTQVVALGTRQVGEVICRLENPDDVLLPGTNINASIRTGRAESALTIPKEAVRRENGATGVYVLTGQTARWRPVSLGLASVNRAEVTQGLTLEDAVAMPAGQALTDGMAVTPVFP